MGVILVLCLKILLLCAVESESSVNNSIRTDACVDDFRDYQGNKIVLDEKCKTHYCINKCCSGKQIVYVNGSTQTCVHLNDLPEPLSTNFLAKKHMEFTNVTIYKDVAGKLENTTKNVYSSDFLFTYNMKLYNKNCLSGVDQTDYFHIFDNASLIVRDQQGNIINHVDKTNYCMDYIVHDTLTGMKGPKFMFKWIVGPKKTNFAGSSVTTNVAPVKAKLSPQEACVDDVRDLGGVKKLNITEYCKNKHCVAKCCKGATRIMYYKPGKPALCYEISKIQEFINTTINVDYMKVNVFKSNIEEKVQKANINLKDDFHFIMNKKLSKQICSSGIPAEPMENFYILENDSLVMELPNFYKRFVRSWPMGDFCIEHFVKHTHEGVHGPFLIHRFLNLTNTTDINGNSGKEDIYKSVAMLISCFFLLLVLFVYGVIRELRNLVGMVLMAYVATLSVTFFFKALELLAVHSENMSSTVCKPMSVFLYYTTISSFFWMNIMSLDIWWTFRGIFKSRPIHRRGELAKFGWYGLYSWGTPLLVTIAVGVIDYSDLRHLPHIYKPHFEFCFYTKDAQMEMRHYLYIPIMVLLITDWIFFLMSAFNIWRIRKSMAKFANDASKYNNNQNRFGLYLKLSLVMGISWVLEVVELPWWLQTVATAYNSLVGVAIFFIFVFKKKILTMLCDRFGIKGKFVDDLRTRYSKYSIRADSSTQDRKRSDFEFSVTPSQTTQT